MTAHHDGRQARRGMELRLIRLVPTTLIATRTTAKGARSHGTLSLRRGSSLLDATTSHVTNVAFLHQRRGADLDIRRLYAKSTSGTESRPWAQRPSTNPDCRKAGFG